MLIPSDSKYIYVIFIHNFVIHKGKSFFMYKISFNLHRDNIDYSAKNCRNWKAFLFEGNVY